MIRTQIQLTELQAKALKELAATQNTSMAELVRQSVDSLLRSKVRRSQQDKKQRALAAVGRFRSGIQDLSSNHDTYLGEVFGQPVESFLESE